jgi:hypothetical protein
MIIVYQYFILINNIYFNKFNMRTLVILVVRWEPCPFVGSMKVNYIPYMNDYRVSICEMLGGNGGSGVGVQSCLLNIINF